MGHILPSLQRMAVGYIIAVCLGITAGGILGYWRALFQVVDTGTANCAFAGFPLSEVPVMGKTGTAERGSEQFQDTSWFAAMVGPTDDPEYVVVTMVEQGEFGGQVAAPITRDVIERIEGDPCLRSIEEDVGHLPGEYARPEGGLLLAIVDGGAAGCVAFHRDGDKVCELRRLYLRPASRGGHIGKALMTAVLDEARKAGYRRARLYTLPSMKDEAISLYHRLGFRDIPPYGEHVIPGAYYMERELEMPSPGKRQPRRGT